MKTAQLKYNIKYILVTAFMLSLAFIPLGKPQEQGPEPTINTQTYMLFSSEQFIQDGIKITDYINLTNSYNNLTISRGNMEVVLEPYIVMKSGAKYTIKQTRESYPQITWALNTANNEYYYKFGLSANNISLAVSNKIDKVGFSVKTSGLTASDITKDGTSLIIKNKIKINFKDLKKAGYNLSINKTDFLIGKINASLGYIFLDPIIEYNLSGTTRRAWDGYSSNLVLPTPPTTLQIPNSQAEFTTAEYVAANKSDNIRATYQIEGGSLTEYYATHRFNFTITETETTITQLNISWEGYGWEDSLNTNNAYLYIWNDTGSKWRFLGMHTATTDFILLRNITNTKAIQNIVTATKQVGLLVIGPMGEPEPGFYSYIYTDRVFIKVTSTSVDKYPGWNSMKRNVSRPKVNAKVQFNITLTDDSGLAWYVFGHNMSGTWDNTTKGRTSGTNTKILLNLTNTATKGKNVSYKWYFNDTSKQRNSSVFGYYVVGNTVPTHNNPLINSTPSRTNYTTTNLTCYPQGGTDIDSDRFANITNWYVNGTPAMVLYMPFDTNSLSNTTYGTYGVKDYSGRNNNGNLSSTANIKWTQHGKTGGAYNFTNNLTKQMIKVPGVEFQNKPFTVEAWVNINRTKADQGVISRRLGGTSWTLRFLDTELNFAAWNSSGQVTFSCSTGSFSITNKTWIHIAGTFDGSVSRVYINGTQRCSDTTTFGYPASTATIEIGLDGSYTNRYFVGLIDEVRIWNRSLSASELYSHWNSGNFNTIVSDETSKGDQWKCEVTPNDVTGDGLSKNSSTLTIIEAALPKPVINWFEFTNSTDIPLLKITNTGLNISTQTTSYIYMKSPNGKIWKCNVNNTGWFKCT